MASGAKSSAAASKTTGKTMLEMRPVPMAKSTVMKHAGHNVHSRSMYHNESNTPQNLNYLKDIEKLRRELDRKDTRNDSMMREMNDMRNAHASQQRELRILAGTFEKCNNERQRLTNECARTKGVLRTLYSEKLRSWSSVRSSELPAPKSSHLRIRSVHRFRISQIPTRPRNFSRSKSGAQVPVTLRATLVLGKYGVASGEEVPRGA